MEKNVYLSDYLKVKTLEDKVRLINAWEEDRGADGEWVYDLDSSEDARIWIDLYGVQSLYECRQVGRYWMGGWQFSYKEKNTEGNTLKCWCIDEKVASDYMKEWSIITEIKDRYEILLEANAKYNTNEETIEWITEIYKGLIDFKGYAIAKGDICEYSYYIWITKSNDGCFEDIAEQPFPTKESCYTSMRDAVLEKMKWNTEYEDVTEELNMDYRTDTHISYEVNFNWDWIEHISYSGTYISLIVKCTANGELEPMAWQRLNDMIDSRNEK